MIGSIIGDIIGSTYEFNPTKDYNFQLFTKEMTYTDDSVLTFAVIESLLDKIPFDKIYSQMGQSISRSWLWFAFQPMASK